MLIWQKQLALALCLEIAGCGIRASAPPPVAPRVDDRTPRPLPVPKPTAPAPDPNELVGLDEAAVRRLLGDNFDSRSDGAARILTFHGTGACAIDVVLFMDMSTGAMQVLSYRFNPTAMRPDVARTCYSALRGPR